MKASFGLACVLLCAVVARVHASSLVVGDNLAQDNIIASIYCSAPTNDDKTNRVNVRVDMGAFAADEAFTHTDNSLIPYDECFLLDVPLYLSDIRHSQTESTSPECRFNRVNTATPFTVGDPDKRLTVASIAGIDASSNGETKCGLYVDGDFLWAYVRCSRKKFYDAYLDQILAVACNLNTMPVTEQGIQLPVGGPTVIVSEHFANVVFKGYKIVGSLNMPSTIPPPLGTVYFDIEDGLSLGEIFFFALSVSNTNGPYGYFNRHNMSPICGYLHTCTVYKEYVSEAGAGPFEIIDADGCNTGSTVFPFYEPTTGEPVTTQTRVLNYLSDGTTNEEVRTPNTQISKLMEVVIAQLDNLAEIRSLTITCGVKYSGASDDPKCFYYEGRAGMTAPTCSARKRKRSYDNDDDDDKLVKTVSLRIPFIHNPEDGVLTIDNVQRHEQKEGCLEKKTFFAIAIVLGILLLIVFAVALAIFVKLHASASDDGSSAQEFHNKAYN